MQRLSRDLRDDAAATTTTTTTTTGTGSGPLLRRIVRGTSSRTSKEMMETTSSTTDVHKARIQESNNTRNIEISAGKEFQIFAHLDESGEYEYTLKEWTVHFLEKIDQQQQHQQDQPYYCPVEYLKRLEIKVGKHYGVKFLRQSHKIHACLHNIESNCEKSLTFTVGNELMLLCRITGCPEERSPNSDDNDTVYEGDFKSLLRMLKKEEMMGANILFGCVIFKDFLLRRVSSAARIIPEEEKTNWETFAR